MKVGVCGTGRMGAAIAHRLISVGHQLGVWNRDPTKTRPLVEAGAERFPSPAELIAGCDTVIIMLLNDAASEAVYLGPHGILQGKLADKLVIDMSTVRPDTMQKISAMVAGQGATFVEAPVAGSTGPAREGKLFALVGGGETDVARAKPILEQLCRRIEHVGPVGSGAALKLAVNLPLLVYWQALGEALTICKPLNLAADRLIDILSDTAGTPAAMKGRGAVIAKALSGQPAGTTAFGLNAARKDLATAIGFAASLHAELPVAVSALSCYEQAETEGLGESDATAIATRWPQRSKAPQK
ncbi:MAG: NAD(P)-dependent oxidoreductase [Bradyrhizobium sp.]|uniref:NAD(P)-dependent oxidoreductase n=1 Tax=Bradyrhizobium sp. TaxID=376 RepID=UPI001DC406E8|nr:NAD(P)-dependent oxidoreductase [Bradyrhizobium sp.]MBV9565979.1 NAD(P)-dependent oxidoreductase [Bradyrhizobium sp.]